MVKRVTYVDSGVLIAAFQAKDELSNSALQVLDDPEREFIVSDFLKLETIPKPSFHKRATEVAFMETFMEAAARGVDATVAITREALTLSGTHDISPMDALHLAAAIEGEAAEFVTTERPEKPMFRVQSPAVVSLHKIPNSATDEHGQS